MCEGVLFKARYLGLRDADFVGNLHLGAPLEKSQRQNMPLALGQPFHRFAQ